MLLLGIEVWWAQLEGAKGACKHPPQLQRRRSHIKPHDPQTVKRYGRLISLCRQLYGRPTVVRPRAPAGVPVLVVRGISRQDTKYMIVSCECNFADQVLVGGCGYGRHPRACQDLTYDPHAPKSSAKFGLRRCLRCHVLCSRGCCLFLQRCSRWDERIVRTSQPEQILRTGPPAPRRNFSEADACLFGYGFGLIHSGRHLLSRASNHCRKQGVDWTFGEAYDHRDDLSRTKLVGSPGVRR